MHFTKLYTKDELVYLKSDGCHAVLIGYEMRLTPIEYRILEILLKEKSLTSDEIVEKHPDLKSCKVSSIPVHICSINKKSMAISGRSLIVSRRNKGYSINENL